MPALDTGITRRRLLGAMALTLGLPNTVLARTDSPASGLFISAVSEPDDRHFVRGFTLDDDGVMHTRFHHALPARAHHVAISEAAGLYVVVARRPGTWIGVGHLNDDSSLKIIDLPAARRTGGHGFFSAGGDRFFTLDIAIDDAGDDGRLAVWQVQEGMLVRGEEFSTGGAGPHEGVLMPDGVTVALANGGIRTSLDSEREMLNLDTMQPSLVYLDTASGRIIQQLGLSAELHQNSIRHLDVNAAGLVTLAMQFEGEPFLDVPLVGMHRPGDPEIHIPEVPLQEQQQLKQYCGSVRFDASGRYVAVSAPRGNRITFWDAEAGAFLSSVRSRDGCGVCAWQQGFLYTAGTGKVNYFDLGSGQSAAMTSDTDRHLLWDNHISRV